MLLLPKARESVYNSLTFAVSINLHRLIDQKNVKIYISYGQNP